MGAISIQELQAACPPGYRVLRDTTMEERAWPEDAVYSNRAIVCVCCGRIFAGRRIRDTCRVCATQGEKE